ncbi:MAG TPA: type I-C CRISPR-associated protein Cas8c/Csd1, partial [Nitrolancea sp.]|nr:type I-C CRISPR-associated protein Cas8c/Csd1 [Nitrolancea sp.]
VAGCHRAFVDLTERCLAVTREPSVAAVVRFLHTDPLDALRLPDEFDPGATITFRVHGRSMLEPAEMPIDLASVQSFWAALNDPASAGNGQIMQCLICGQERPVLDRLQGKIKGVPGGQTAGTSIISANEEAFESYGLEASLIAPTCADCGERFTKALNELLSKRENHIVLGGSVFIFWTRREESTPWFGLLTDPQPEQVRDLLAAVLKTRRTGEFDATAFYGAVLSGSGGRAVVRDWIDTTVGVAQQRLTAWFAAQRIIDPYGEEGRPLGIYALAAGTVRDLKDVPPTTLRTLLRAALAGTPLPADLLSQAVRRNQAEQGITRQRAALIKLVLLSLEPEQDGGEDSMIKLDPAHPSPAYHCGRLLAVLEEAQRAAIPGIKATLVDRFYGSASTAPGSVFPRLVRGAQPHLSKLERDREAAYHAIQQRLEDIQGNLTRYPKVLALEEQGLFALGYYHQRAFDRAQAREAAERRRNAASTAGQQPELESKSAAAPAVEGEN